VAILPKADARAAEDSFDLAQRIITSAQDAAKRLNRDISLKAAVERLPAWQGLTSDQRRLLDFHIVSAIEHEYAEDWDRLSAWWFDEADEHPGGDALIPEGYDRLLAPLARGIDIRLNTAVRRVGPAPEGVRAVLADGRTVTADAAVVAVPLAVLASGRVAVDGLAGRAEAALQALGTGLLNKVALRFDRAFWPADAGWVQHVPVRRGQFQEWVPLPGGTPAIMGFHAGSPARALEPLSDRDTAAEAVAALRSMLGSAVPDPLGVQVSRWQADAFALGSYSHYPVGATPDDRRALADVIGGRIVLAGEYVATDHPSTVHGAIQSGRRAARLL
jgi:monoamine oxidase